MRSPRLGSWGPGVSGSPGAGLGVTREELLAWQGDRGRRLRGLSSVASSMGEGSHRSGQGGQAQVRPSVCNSDLIRKSSLSTILWRINKSSPVSPAQTGGPRGEARVAGRSDSRLNKPAGQRVKDRGRHRDKRETGIQKKRECLPINTGVTGSIPGGGIKIPKCHGAYHS